MVFCGTERALTALLGVGALQVAQEQERSAQLSEALSVANQRHAEAMAAMQVLPLLVLCL